MVSWRAKRMPLAEGLQYQNDFEALWEAHGYPEDAALFEDSGASSTGVDMVMVLSPGAGIAFEALSPGGWDVIDKHKVTKWAGLAFVGDPQQKWGIALG